MHTLQIAYRSETSSGTALAYFVPRPSNHVAAVFTNTVLKRFCEPKQHIVVVTSTRACLHHSRVQQKPSTTIAAFRPKQRQDKPAQNT